MGPKKDEYGWGCGSVIRKGLDLLGWDEWTVGGVVSQTRSWFCAEQVISNGTFILAQDDSF
jgi:hypothetical protein